MKIKIFNIIYFIFIQMVFALFYVFFKDKIENILNLLLLLEGFVLFFTFLYMISISVFVKKYKVHSDCFKKCYNNFLMMTKRIIKGIYDELQNVIGIEEDEYDKQIRISLEKNIDELLEKIHCLRPDEMNTNLMDSIYDDFQKKILKISALYGQFEEESKYFEKIVVSLIQYFMFSLPIISDMSRDSVDYAQQQMNIITDTIENILTFTDNITNDINLAMGSMVDMNSDENLAFVKEKNKNIIKSFEKYQINMKSLRSYTEDFSKKVFVSFEEINNIVDEVNDLAETIKIISLNLNIEAAKQGNSNSSFSVLAENLTSLSNQIMEFSSKAKNQVEEITISLEDSNEEYIKKFENNFKQVLEMNEEMENLSPLIDKSFNKTQEIINHMKNFSEDIQDKIRNIVGKLQFHDLTFQELEHFAHFYKKLYGFIAVFDVESDDRVKKLLSEEEKNEIKKNIVEALKEITTTANEQSILERYIEKFGVKGLKYETISKSDKNDDNFIMF